MDNRLNEVRKEISALRAEMLALENLIRLQVRNDLDCSEVATRLMGMRQAVVALIRERDALGGGELCPSVAQRLGRTGPGVLGKRVPQR